MRLTMITTVLVFMAGCASAPPEFTEGQRQKIQNTTPICQTDRQCERAWSAARNYVRETSDFRIRMSSDDMIATYGPKRWDPGLAFEVVKNPVDGGYEIKASTTCGGGTQCFPKRGDALVEFNRRVNDAME